MSKENTGFDRFADYFFRKVQNFCFYVNIPSVLKYNVSFRSEILKLMANKSLTRIERGILVPIQTPYQQFSNIWVSKMSAFNKLEL